MKSVAKYNTFKAISTLLTGGAPIITLVFCGETFITEPKASLSAAAVFAILLTCLACKDKLAETIKTPSTFIISAAVLLFIVIVENILIPVKYVCIVTLCTSGIDELTFKRMYKIMESKFPQNYKEFEHFGFICCTTKNLEELNG